MKSVIIIYTLGGKLLQRNFFMGRCLGLLLHLNHKFYQYILLVLVRK